MQADAPRTMLQRFDKGTVKDSRRAGFYGEGDGVMPT